MNSNLFPKPPPATPLPLDEWLIRTDRAESGREAFFRGRDVEYGVFQSALTSLGKGTIGGGTMIFQGAPGAGKSALMNECMEAVRRHSTPDDPWVAVSITPGALGSPTDVIKALVRAVNTESKRLRNLSMETGFSGTFKHMLTIGRKLSLKCDSLYRELSVRGGGAFGLSLGGRRDGGVKAGEIFQTAGRLLRNYHVVVCVDEAQNTPVSHMTVDVLDCLHRDPQGIPLVTAFFGLSDTQAVLRECGLSRFADERVVNLEPLRSEDAACAIRDMFIHYDFPGSAVDLAVWVDRLTKLSQGWPQHINRVSVAAMRVLRDHSGYFEPSLLERVLERGQERKEEYYLDRLAAGSSRAWVYHELAIEAEYTEGYLSIDDIDTITEQGRLITGESLNGFLTNALHAGLLAPVRTPPDHYRIPIPSLGDYLRELPALQQYDSSSIQDG